MSSNLDRYKKDLDALLLKGHNLQTIIQAECSPSEVNTIFKKEYGDKAQEMIDKIPKFRQEYQIWYSESKILIKQLLPDRLDDFVRYYEKPRSRKNVSVDNYTIEDYLQGLGVTRGWQKEKVVGPDAAIPLFQQQLAILKSLKARFESSLFDIAQLVQADFFDSELDAAKELRKKKFTRAGGAIAGVVLEKHLCQVCQNHTITIAKKNPSISDYNDKLKDSEIIDVPTWRFIQHLADVRNLCDHDKKNEPSESQVDDLIIGVSKIVKTLF